VNGLHVESVAEDELDFLFEAQVSQPILGEHALGADNQVLTVPVDGGQELARLGLHVPVQNLIALLVEHTQVHPLRVQINATMMPVLAVVESHHDAPC
jgi:hypothetical protein